MDSKYKQLLGIITAILLLLELEFVAIGCYTERKFTELENYYRENSSNSITIEAKGIEECDVEVTIETQPCLHCNTHTFIMKEASCVEIGHLQTICRDCEIILKEEEIPKEEHQIDVEEPWKYNKLATLSESGKRYKSCTNCGELVYEEYELSLLEGNSIYITGTDINDYVTVSSFSQYSVDNYDIVYAEDLYFDSNNPFIMGHNYGSLRNLPQTEVGEYIYLYIDNVLEIYEVVVSEYGLLISEATDILGQTTGARIRDTYDCKTLHLYTCYGISRKGRWMVLAKQIY